jgi:hypothetical protein
MKKTLLGLLLVIGIASCGKKDSPEPEKPSGFSVSVKQNSTLQTGQIIVKDVACIIMVWKANGKDFDLSKTMDMAGGYALDKNSNVSFKYD